MSDAEQPVPSGPTPGEKRKRDFWGEIDAKFLILTLAGLGGLLGPVSELISGQYKLHLDAAAAEEKQRLDFLAELVKAQELKDDSQRVLARLDVLELLNSTISTDDRLAKFVSTELEQTRSQYNALLALQVARSDLAAVASGASLGSTTATPPSSSSATAALSGARPPASVAPPSAEGPPPIAAAETLKVLRSAQRQVAARVLQTSPVLATQPLPSLRPCLRITASAPGSVLLAADLETACRASDHGEDSWLARVQNTTVGCVCSAR